MRRISRPATTVSIAVLGIAALTLGACGSSYKGLSKTEFIKQTDAACKDYDTQLTGLFRHASANPTLAQVKSIYTDKLIPLFRKEVGALRAIKAPKEDRAAVAKIFDDLSTGIDQIDSAVSDAKSLNALEAVSPPALKSADAEAKAYGMKVCGAS